MALLAVTLGAIAVVVPYATAQAGPSAVAAGSLSFNVSSSLHLIGRPGHVLNERGTFTGSQSGTIALLFTSVTSSSGEASFTAYSSKGGSVSGRTKTRSRIVGPTAYFSGVMTITGGTGRWAHASGHNLQFSGTLDRRKFSATTQMRGTIKV